MTKEEKTVLANDLAEEVTGGKASAAPCTDGRSVFKDYPEQVALTCTMQTKFIRKTVDSVLPKSGGQKKIKR